MKTNPFIFIIALCGVSCLSACSDPCRESGDLDSVEFDVFYTIKDKTTNRNLLDGGPGSWIDTIRVKDLKTQKIVGRAPDNGGTAAFAYFDENADTDAFNAVINKKFMVNLRYSRDTFEVSFKMKYGQCRRELESMRIILIRLILHKVKITVKITT
jgi:hypothetical protein